MITREFADIIGKEIMNRNNMKIKNIEINYLAGEVERLKSMIDNLDKVIDRQLNKEDLIMNELAKEGYSVNFSEDENGELKCNLIKEEK